MLTLGTVKFLGSMLMPPEVKLPVVYPGRVYIEAEKIWLDVMLSKKESGEN